MSKTVTKTRFSSQLHEFLRISIRTFSDRLLVLKQLSLNVHNATEYRLSSITQQHQFLSAHRIAHRPKYRSRLYVRPNVWRSRWYSRL